MNSLGKGLVAGFAGTVVLSALMIAKTMMGLMPEFDVIKILSSQLGQPNQPIYGWFAHFTVGTILWGGLFSAVADNLPGSYWLRGVLFGVFAWLLMMIGFFPYVGAGLFGLQIGMMIPVATLMLHVFFGAAMGATYGALQTSQPMKQA